MVKKGSATQAGDVELAREQRQLRWLRVQTDLLRAVLWQDARLDVPGARELVFAFRGAVSERFPGKEEVFDLVLLPRFERIIRERWPAEASETVN